MNEWVEHIYPGARADEDEVACIIRSIIKGTKHLRTIYLVVFSPMSSAPDTNAAKLGGRVDTCDARPKCFF